MTDVTEQSSEQWVCQSCAWTYDPAEGFYDGESGVAYDPGTPWEALHETIVCPTCGSPKSTFRKVDQVD